MVDADSPSTWVTPSREVAEEWALVLNAAGIENRVERTAGGWTLRYAWTDQERAAAELAAFQEENRRDTIPREEPQEYGKTYAGFALAACLVLFYLVTGPRNPAVIWFRAGSAVADAILAGEWWRSITALTLHADPPHIFSNAVSAVVFVTAVCRQLGPGVGLLLVLLSGGIGNLINAVAHGSHHASVGASTALFGAIGILAGLQVATWRRRRSPWPRAWVPLAAGLALLVMLGTGKNADIGAHLFGFAAGVPLGAAAAALSHPPGRMLQWSLALAVVTATDLCWLLALRAVP
jgi:rhomboid protease GluP